MSVFFGHDNEINTGSIPRILDELIPVAEKLGLPIDDEAAIVQGYLDEDGSGDVARAYIPMVIHFSRTAQKHNYIVWWYK